MREDGHIRAFDGNGVVGVFASVLLAAALAVAVGFPWGPAFADDGSNAGVAVDSEGDLAVGSFETPEQDAVEGGVLGALVAAPGEDDAAGFVRPVRFTGDSVDTIVLPSYADLSSLRLCYGSPTDGFASDTLAEAYVSPTRQGAFAKQELDVRPFAKDALGGCRVFAKDSPTGAVQQVRIVKSANVRAMFLTSDDPLEQGRAYVEASADHSAKATGKMLMVSADGEVAYDGALTQIKGRGNATWDAQKKPYQIKLDKKTALLDGEKSNKAKTWVLLANAYDETVGVRNYIALRTALSLGLSNTPECDFVDLYYDGEYRGLYLLSEKVQVNGGRVEIDEIENVSDDDVDLEDRPTKRAKNDYGYEFQYVEGAVLDSESEGDDTGGYLLETNAERYAAERSWFMSSIGAIELKSPEDASYEQVKYVSERFQEMVDVLSEPDGDAESVIDVSSLARTHLVNEFAKNFDYLLYSTYFYLPKDSAVFYAGPVWDFDLAFGVFPYRADGGEYIDAKGYAAQSRVFFGTNKAVISAVKSAFANGALSTMTSWVKATGGIGGETVGSTWNRIAKAATWNDFIWSSGVQDNAYVMFGNPLEAISYLGSWIKTRIEWLSETIPETATFRTVDYSGVGEAAIASATQGKPGTTRLWGEVALDTMSSIIDRGQFEAGSMAVLVTAEGYWDALTASGVAGMVNAPIIMTLQDSLSDQARSQLAKLQPRTIIVCGGEAAVTPAVANAAADAAGGAKVERLWGNMASDTAVAIFDRGAGMTGGSWARTAFVCTANGYWDALAASPISYATGMPIFLADDDGAVLSDDTVKALKGSVSAVYIVGGEAAVKPSVEEQLDDAGIPVAGRLWGETAAETSSEVAAFGLAKGMNAANVGVATMNGYWDALAAAPFCGRMNAVMVLAGSPVDSSITGFLKSRADVVDSAFVFGGSAAVSEATLQAVSRAIESETERLDNGSPEKTTLG